MQAELLSRTAAGFAQLRADARTLNTMRVPRWFGGSERREAQAVVDRLLRTGGDTEQALREAGLNHGADWLRRALDRLSETELSGKLFSPGVNFEDTMGLALTKARHGLLVGWRDSLTSSAADGETLLSIARMANLDTDTGVIGRSGRMLRMLGPVADAASMVKLVRAPDDVEGAIRMRAAWQAGRAEADKLNAQGHAMMVRDITELDASDVQRLDELLARDPTGEMLAGAQREGSGIASMVALSIRDPGHAGLEQKANGYLGRWSVATAPYGEQVDIARTILNTPTREVTDRQWFQLQELVSNDMMELAVREALGGGDQASDLLAISGRSGVTNARQLHAKRLVSKMSDEELRAAAKAIVTRSPTDVSGAEFALLEQLAHSRLPVHDRIEGLDVHPMSRIASEYVDSPFTHGGGWWDPTPHFSAWNRSLDPEYAQRVERAFDEMATTNPSDEARAIAKIEHGQLDQLIKHRPAHERRVIAWNILAGDRTLTASKSVGSVLEVLRTTLAEAGDVPADLEKLRVRTLQLIDDNLQRMRGVTPAGQRRGYLTHPEYSEIGRIRANIDLFEAAIRARDANTGVRPRTLQF